MQKRGGASGDCLEKGELVEALLASGNSSASTCSVCCEDYEPGGCCVACGADVCAWLVLGSTRPSLLDPEPGVGPCFQRQCCWLLLAANFYVEFSRLKVCLVTAALAGLLTTARAPCCAGDVLRLLGCGHRFHLECIDRWLLSSTDYSRPPACPMCNAELEKPAAQGSRVAGSGATRA